MTLRRFAQQAFGDDDLDEFVVVNVPFNSWGYWREFVQSSMARLGLRKAEPPPAFAMDGRL